MWGSEAYLRDLLGDGVTQLDTRTGVSVNESFEQPLDFREFMRRALRPDDRGVPPGRGEGRVEELDAAFAGLCERRFQQTRSGRWRLELEYLLAIAAAAPEPAYSATFPARRPRCASRASTSTATT